MVSIRTIETEEWHKLRRSDRLYDFSTNTFYVGSSTFFYRVVEDGKSVTLEYAVATWVGPDYEVVISVLRYSRESGKKIEVKEDYPAWLEWVEECGALSMEYGVHDVPDDVVQNTSPIIYDGKFVRKNRDGHMFMRADGDSDWILVSPQVFSVLAKLGQGDLSSLLSEADMMQNLTKSRF